MNLDILYFILFIKSNFVRVNRLFVFVHSNQDDDSKRFKVKYIIYQKV